MGGKKVFTDHKDCIKKKNCEVMKHNMYPVDFTYQLYRIMIGIKNKKRNNNNKIHRYIDTKLIDTNKTKTIEQLIQYEDKVAHLIATCSFVETCIEKRIFTIFVFDGKAPNIKRKKLEERKKNRNKANEECMKITDKTSDNFIKQHKRTVELRDVHFKESKELLKAMGLIEVQSPGEADPQCAAIASCLHNIDSVITEDSDVLIFGGPQIIKNFNRKNTIINTISLIDILKSLKTKANTILKKNNLTLIKEFKDEYFVDLRILLGTDYNDPITLLDSNKIFELFVLNNFDIPNMIECLKTKKNIEISVNFEEKWKEVRKYYLEADVIDPMTIDLTLKYPNLEKMINILHIKNKFDIKFVKKLYSELICMYNLYYNISNDDKSGYKNYVTFKNLKYYNRNKNKPRSRTIEHNSNMKNNRIKQIHNKI